MNSRWLLSGAIASVLFVGVPLSARAADHPHDPNPHDAPEHHDEVSGERVIDMRDLPDAARERIRHDFHEADVHRIVAYEVHGRTHFHVLVWAGADHRTLVMDESGNVTDIKYPVPFDELPGRVKETIGHETREDAVINVEKITHGDRTYFVATIATHRGDERIVRVSPDGDLLKETYEDDAVLVSEREFPGEQRQLRADVKREDTRFDDLPEDVRHGIHDAAGEDPIRRVEHIWRDHEHSIFRVWVGRDRLVIVDYKGRPLSDKETEEYFEPREEHHR